MSTTFPQPIYTVRLSPLAERLDADQVLATATAIFETPAVLGDPRLQGDAALMAVYSGACGRYLLAWPDGSLGFVHLLRPGHTVAQAIATAYETARAALEALHLQDAAPADAITH